MSTFGNPHPVIDTSLVLNLDSINLNSYREVVGGNVVINGGFNTATDWITATWVISGGVANKTAEPGVYTSLRQNMLTFYKRYRVEFDCVRIAGTVNVWLGGNILIGGISITGKFSAQGLCDGGGNGYLYIEATPDFVGSVDNVTVEELSTTWTDLSGNGNNGTMINGPTYDYSDSSIAFDGTNDAVEVVSTSALEPTVLTVEMYVKRISSYGNILAMTSAGAGAGQPYRMSMNANYPEFSIYGNTGNIGVVSTTSMTSGVWYHLIGTYDRNYMRLYINGVLNNSYAITEPINYTWSSFISLGRKNSDYSGAYFAGNIMGVKIYNRVLSATEVLQNYNALKSRKKFNATGGIITIVDGYKIHTFNSSGTFTTNMNGNVEVLVVAGGGSGHGGGGGGGGGVVRHNKFSVFGNTVVTIGAGGTGGGGNGINSTFSTLTAIGGGSGGEYGQNGYNGGSGGGGASYTTATGGLGVVGQGNSGGAVTSGVVGAGGGGAGTIGGNGGSNVGGNGGNGLLISISGYPVYYGGGGGGGAPASLNVGTGGLGGGGVGGYLVNSSGNGVPNTGGGAGGGYNGFGGTGGSGVIIVRYQVK